MGFIVSVPTYMYQSSSGYIFRIRVPADIRGVVGKCELRYSHFRVPMTVEHGFPIGALSRFKRSAGKHRLYGPYCNFALS